jgi:hypothetical protein
MRHRDGTRRVTSIAVAAIATLTGVAVPALARQPARLTPAPQAAVVYTVPLTRPGTVQRGTATLTLTAATGQVCYRVTTAHLAPVLAAHIHLGGAGVSGPIVVPLFGYSAPKTWTFFTGCVHAAPATLTAILRAPAAYYVNVHTTQYPAGAIRGQLAGRSSTGGATGVPAPGAVALTTALARPGTAQRGTAALTVNAGTGQVCYRLTVAHLAPVLAAHIHAGGAGVNGPIVVPLFGYSPPKTWTLFTGCVRAARPLLAAILRDPSAYYVNVHTTQYPAGAIRGQL